MMRCVSTRGVRGKGRSVSTLIYSWGSGSDGQLGHAKFENNHYTFLGGNTYLQVEPRKMLKSKRYTCLAVGETFTLGVDGTANALYGWGRGEQVGIKKENKTSGQLLAEPRLIPMPKSDIKVSKVYSSGMHSAVIDSNGLIYTWGSNGVWSKGGGQLGHGNKDECLAPKLVESFANYGAKAHSMALGSLHTLILTDDGEVLSCGSGEHGRLGDGLSDDVVTPQPIEALANEDVIQIAAGKSHSLALTSTGKIYSWGRNHEGQLGHVDAFMDMMSFEVLPREIFSDELKNYKIQQIAAGSQRSAAVSTCGRMFIWGKKANHYPTLVDPALFKNLKIKKILLGGTASGDMVAVITEDGGLWTFGDFKSGLLGYAGTIGRQTDPVRIETFKNTEVVDVVASSTGHGTQILARVKSSDP